MKVALLITTFNRPKELAECLRSVKEADLSRVNELMIVDDGSTDFKTKSHIQSLNFKDSHKNLVIKQSSKGIKDSLITGCEHLFKTNDIVINLDGDAVVKPTFVNDLIKLYKSGLDGCLLTGFHSETKNIDGSDRHKILNQNEYYYFKQSVGGINFCIDKEAYINYLKPALNMPGNFDHNACILAGGAYCLKESVIQHTGFASSMGHHELPDTAEDFYLLELPDVTLIGADSKAQRLELAKLKCTNMIKFGATVLLHPNIISKEQYSEYAMREMAKHVHTSHALIFQHDGFVNNWRAWDNDWLQYDYIGAPWWYNDGMNVGNGGFSLRSKRLMDILATDPHIQQLHPEDHHICRTYRPYLESTYGIKFAPYEVAESFAFEGYMRPGEVVTDQFGVHGNYPAQKKTGRKYVFNQPGYLGDILFLVPMYRALAREGNELLWPIDSKFMSVAPHFPDINFVCKDEYQLPYDNAFAQGTPHGEMLPYRFTDRFGMRECMRMKYAMYGHDHLMWRELTWKRFPEHERELATVVGAKGEYVLVNRYYGNKGDVIAPKLPEAVRVVEIQPIDGYSLLDWCLIIENAKEIHTASTSILFLLEILPLKMPIHFYKRGLHGEVAYEHTDYLFTKDYILH